MYVLLFFLTTDILPVTHFHKQVEVGRKWDLFESSSDTQEDWKTGRIIKSTQSYSQDNHILIACSAVDLKLKGTTLLQKG